MRIEHANDCTKHNFTTLPAGRYAYLLGMYLGDGCISRSPRTWRLRITCDAKYAEIIAECREAIDVLMPGQLAAIVDRKDGCTDVSLSSKHWPCLFPQHGPGRKHSRKIALEPWQQEHVDLATEEFLRGLIHSDGCRVVANDRGVASVRYHFTNRSEDILGLFSAALDNLDIPWTRSTGTSCPSTARRPPHVWTSFIGPKR
ncbi:LAGLIDADG family homing endonuclease [Mycobacteroides saopaulense]|uniref:LAGLIDADG family homing endonuclease n=1 Tax=Mycobacteroides saopaulense TaxID=1578165 RepID=UPI001F46F502|nr:LAGLIDADG family homing endonuclease [Mycobacteroides saopaulense]